MSDAPGSSIRVYEGVVKHRRVKPVRHHLRYRVFSFLIDIDALPRIARGLRWFSLNRFNLFSVFAKDHGARAGEDLGEAMRRMLTDNGVRADGRILMLAYPRMLGYAFNPITVFYAYGANGDLRAIFYQVRNTFGGRHAYLAPIADPQTDWRHDGAKLFHVSPFIDMDMRYRFAAPPPGEEAKLSILVEDREGPLLTTSFVGEGADVDDGALVSLFFRYPLMTVKVVAGIHWEAVKLLAKGLRLKPAGPTPPSHVSVIGRAHGRD